MFKIFYSKYLIFIFLSLLLNIVISIISNIKNNKLKVESVLKCSILETMGIILGAKILDIVVNGDIYLYKINNKLFLEILTSGYAFLGGIFGAVLSIAIYSIITNEDFEELCNILVPNLLLVYAISKIGCFFAGCCIGIYIRTYLLPIQLIESVIYSTIYILVILRKKEFYEKISLICLLFGFARFFVEFFRENTGYMYLSISQVISISIFTIGIMIKVKMKKKTKP